MEKIKLLTPYKLGNIELKNHIVMAPMTRSRAIGNVPNDLMAKYYGQRSGAGLIVTEGTSPSPNGLGYSRIPGIFSQEQVEGWKKITTTVHNNGGKIFVQLMHTGRIGHVLNLPQGAKVVAPSAVQAAGKMWTDQEGMQDNAIPEAISADEIQSTINEYVEASINGIKAGFDGVELHGANGYLLEQFLSPISNIRTDQYGGTIENRCRFVLEVTEKVCEAIGKDKVGIRLSPFGIASDMPHYPEIEEEYTYLVKELNKIGILYVHVVDHSASGAPEVPISIKKTIRDNFSNTVILVGGQTKESAESLIESGLCDLVAFGKPYIINPDLVSRFENNYPLSTTLDFNTFYTPGEEGYTSYPNYN